MGFTLDGLTTEQVELLDFMWSLKTLEEFEAWREVLSDETRQQVDLLHRLVVLANLDEALTDTTEADAVIQKIMNIDK